MYTKSELIGNGGFGKVFKGRLLHTDKTFAIKSYHKFSFNQLRCGNRTEIDFLSRADHPNIVKVHDVYLVGGEVNVVMDLADDNLENYLNKNKLSSLQKEYLAGQFVSAMQYIHLNGYLHADIKCENILVFDKLQIKLADFGKARHIDNNNDRRAQDRFCSSIAYRAPELLTREGIFRRLYPNYYQSIPPTWDNLVKAEYYSIGRLLLDIITNTSRCTVENFIETLKLTFLSYEERVKKISKLSDGINIDLIYLTAKLMSADPADRVFPLSGIYEAIPLPKVLRFNIFHEFHLPAIRFAASVAARLHVKPIEFSQALSLYYNLFPYGISYLNLLIDEIKCDERVHMIMATSLLLTSQPSSYEANYLSVFSMYKPNLTSDTLLYFIQDAYVRLKGVVMYDHIGNYTRKYGAYVTWYACRYYTSNSLSASKKEMAEYVKELDISQMDCNIDCSIGELPAAVFNSIF